MVIGAEPSPADFFPWVLAKAISARQQTISDAYLPAAVAKLLDCLASRAIKHSWYATRLRVVLSLTCSELKTCRALQRTATCTATRAS